MTPTLTPEQTAELARLKSWRPFMVVYGAINPATGEWLCAAVPTKRIPNDLARKGWQVFIVSR